MGEKFRYYVPFLAFVVRGSKSLVAPDHAYYNSAQEVETEDQIERMRQTITERINPRPEYITILDWKRIQ